MSCLISRKFIGRFAYISFSLVVLLQLQTCRCSALSPKLIRFIDIIVFARNIRAVRLKDAFIQLCPIGDYYAVVPATRMFIRKL